MMPEAGGRKPEIARRMAMWAVVALIAMALAAPLRAQQGTPPAKPKPDSVPVVPKRRALEIRGQAPAPEVVTVRPREIPPFTHRIITPLLDSTSIRRPAQPAIILKPE